MLEVSQQNMHTCTRYGGTCSLSLSLASCDCTIGGCGCDGLGVGGGKEEARRH